MSQPHLHLNMYCRYKQTYWNKFLEEKQNQELSPLDWVKTYFAHTIQLNFCNGRPGSDPSGSCNDAAETPVETYCESYHQYVKKLSDLNNQHILISCIVHGLVHLRTAVARLESLWQRQLRSRSNTLGLSWMSLEFNIIVYFLIIFEAMRRFTKEPHAVRDQLVVHQKVH